MIIGLIPKVIKQEVVSYKRMKYIISTVEYSGRDHDFGDDPQKYWKIIVRQMESFSTAYRERYSSKEDAKNGHKEAKKLLMSGKIVK